MRFTKSWLIALWLLALVRPADAREPAPIPAVPIGNPGAWIETDDYPSVALRYGIAGVTAFRLIVDSTGKPSRCDIVESSGFDLLDASTCERLMARARFSPPRNKAGRALEGVYTNRVRWVLPDVGRLAVGENFSSMLLSVDETDKVTSCRLILHVPATAAALADKHCEDQVGTRLPPEIRGGYQGPSAEVEMQFANVFTPALRARVLAPKPGFAQRALNIFRLTITRDGKVAQCRYEEQRGIAQLAISYCGVANNSTFDPPFSAFDKDGVASGWYIARILLRTGQ